jgi:hypothetical protein
MRANVVVWPAGRPLVRCYTASYGPLSFNPTSGSARFRPTYETDTATGSRIVTPTAYVGEDAEIALAETVLREATPGGVLPAARLDGVAIAAITSGVDLPLLQLNGYGLRKLGLNRADVIDTGSYAYPEIARIAQALQDAHLHAAGIVWTSHQADHGDAAILWETLLDTSDLSVIDGPLALDGPIGIALVRNACQALDVTFVP